MARGMMRWVAVALAVCVAVAVAYLPPRGGVREPKERWIQISQPTPARLRAQGLADEWRAAAAAVRLAEHRRQLESLWARLPADHEGPTLLLAGPDSIPPSARAMLAAALDSAWRRLGLGAPKVAVGVTVELWSGRTSIPGLPEVRDWPAYLLPDSTDRATCVVLIPAGVYWTRAILGERWMGQPPVQNAQLVAWMMGGLGPCAFFAAYGAPGKPVRRWLARRNYDLAQLPAWADSGQPRQETWRMMSPTTGRWWWDWVYHQRFTAVACLGGRPSGCRAAVLAKADGGLDDSIPRVAVLDRRWWSGQRLVGGDRYLADVAREVGRERFLRFWNSSLPVDTALTAALKAPIGDWTARWERTFSPRGLPLGAAAPPSAVALAILLTGGAVTIVALTASRRQIR